MESLIGELKAQARVLHRDAARLHEPALARLGLSPQQAAEKLQRRHCLAIIASEPGFNGWPHVVAVLAGENDTDFGTLLYPPGGAAHSNIWCARYQEAESIRTQTGGFLLAYKHQFFVADKYFIETLGVDPDDGDWELIGRDWVRPRDVQARVRLYRGIIRARQKMKC